MSRKWRLISPMIVGRRVRRELHAAVEVEAVDRLDQPDRADLDQVVERLAAVAEPPGAVLDQRQVQRAPARRAPSVAAGLGGVRRRGSSANSSALRSRSLGSGRPATSGVRRVVPVSLGHRRRRRRCSTRMVKRDREARSSLDVGRRVAGQGGEHLPGEAVVVGRRRRRRTSRADRDRQLRRRRRSKLQRQVGARVAPAAAPSRRPRRRRSAGPRCRRAVKSSRAARPAVVVRSTRDVGAVGRERSSTSGAVRPSPASGADARRRPSRGRASWRRTSRSARPSRGRSRRASVPGDRSPTSLSRSAQAFLVSQKISAISSILASSSSASPASSAPLVPVAPASLVASLTSVCSCGYFSKCGGLK